MRASAAACAALAAACTASAPAAAQDPAGFERFPGAAVVAYAPAETVARYEFVTGRVDRSRRERRVEDSIRFAAEVTRVTYRAPADTRFDDVIDHYRALLADAGAEVAFRCRARDCGRSTTWANDIFGVKELTAPDSAQFYAAARIGDVHAAIYIVQRGNRRIYAHVDIARRMPDASAPLAQLRRRGFAVLPGAAPQPDGALGARQFAALDALAAELAAFGEPLYLVCHVPAQSAADAGLASARACAAAAAERLSAQGADIRPFAAGALLPRPSAAPNRLELVRLRQR